MAGSFCVCEEDTDCAPHGFLSVVSTALCVKAGEPSRENRSHAHRVDGDGPEHRAKHTVLACVSGRRTVSPRLMITNKSIDK